MPPYSDLHVTGITSRHRYGIMPLACHITVRHEYMCGNVTNTIYRTISTHRVLLLDDKKHLILIFNYLRH